MGEERIERLEKDLHEVLVRLRVVEQNQARSDERHSNIDKRFDRLEERFNKLDKTISKAVWMIIGSVLIPLVIFLITNGVS